MKTKKVTDIILTPSTARTTETFGGLHYTCNHTGKMMGIYSLSTSPLNNPACVARRANPNSICSVCFSVSLLKRYKGVAPLLERNGEILRKSVLPSEVLPVLTCTRFRVEAFGDIGNDTQVINYFNLARKNPRTSFALYTKNPAFIASAIRKGHAKPENLTIVLSSPLINKPLRGAIPFVDKVFTCWDSEKVANEKGVTINCGARACSLCGRCYTRGGEKYINEIVK